MAEDRPVPDATPGPDGPGELARTDRFVDALAAGEPAPCDGPGDRTLAALLEGWRDELRSPEDGLVSEAFLADAGAALRGEPRRPRRSLAAIGSAAAAVVALGGFGGAVASSHPGDALYNVRSVLFGEPASVVDDRIVLTAKTELDEVQQMITQGQWEQAQQRLVALGDTVQAVNDTQRRQDLVDQWNRLSVQVQSRDPNAAPPGR